MRTEGGGVWERSILFTRTLYYYFSISLCSIDITIQKLIKIFKNKDKCPLS